MLVAIDTRRICDWDSFHDVFAEAFGFPAFYGRNLDAWIDCLGSLDRPLEGMTAVHVQPGEVVSLLLDHVDDFAQRCPEQYAAIVECSALVNWRRATSGESPVLALAFCKSPC
jgi:RNAse (barnase) inhibitor barstar